MKFWSTSEKEQGLISTPVSSVQNGSKKRVSRGFEDGEKVGTQGSEATKISCGIMKTDAYRRRGLGTKSPGHLKKEDIRECGGNGRAVEKRFRETICRLGG